MKPYRFTWLIALWVTVFVTYVPWAEHSSLQLALLAADNTEQTEGSSASLPEKFPVISKMVLKRNKQSPTSRLNDFSLPRPLLTVKTERSTIYHPANVEVREPHLQHLQLNMASRAPPATVFHV